MRQERYGTALVSRDALSFEFTSKGPKGSISKLVHFVKTSNPAIYRLEFGDKMPGGGLNHHARNNNKDRDKILATIAIIIYEFTARRPEKYIFFTGSSAARTRLYRMAITVYYDELSQAFEIYGMTMSGSTLEPEVF